MSDELANHKARYERLNLLYQVSNVIHSTLEPHKALQLIVDEAVQLMRASSGSVALFNPTTGFLEIEAARGLPPAASKLKLKLGEGVTGWVARAGKPARVGDVSKDPRYVMVRRNVRSELAVPLEVNGIVRGVLNVDSDRLNAFTAENQELLQELGAQAAKVIQNTWLYEQLRLKARLFELLVSVSQAINSTLNLDDALTVITREACQLMAGKMCTLLLLDDTCEWLDLRASHGASEAYLSKPRLSAAESLLGIVVRRKKPLQVENVQTSSRYQHVDIARRGELVSLLSVPLVFGGQALGTLSVYTGAPHVFSNEEIRNPLTVMKMLYHALDLRFASGDPRAKDAEIMGAQMELMNRIVEQILDFARTPEPEFAGVNLNELIEELGLLTRHKLTQQNVLLVRKLEPNLPPVMADAAQLEQVFLNLILNAVEAMPDGGKLTIASRAPPPPG